MVAEPDPVPAHDRADGNCRAAQHADQRSVYLWTFAHTTLAGRAKPEEFSRETFSQALLTAYSSTGKVVEQWSVFEEVHPSSKSERERRLHFHMLVETDKKHRWLEVAKRLRDDYAVYASVATSSSRNSYWSAFAYLYAPSAKKPKEDLDGDYLLSPGHEEPPQSLVNRRLGSRRLQPVELFETVVKHNLGTLLKLFAFAARQHHAGDSSWLKHCMKSPQKRLQEDLDKALAMAAADERLARDSMTHMDMLREALATVCVCQGRAIPGWQEILVTNGFDVDAYRRSVLQLFQAGGGKALNHLYLGEASSGKTGLTKPLCALFGEYAFLKPQVGTTFALQGMVGCKAVIWNDFRWPHPPLAWGDLLNVLDNEPFNIAVPKVDGKSDVKWNEKEDQNVIAVITGNSEIVYLSGHAVNPVETKAWYERFGLVLRFTKSLPKPDKRYKHWFKCIHCYATWITGADDGPVTPPPPKRQAVGAAPSDSVPAPSIKGSAPGAGGCQTCPAPEVSALVADTLPAADAAIEPLQPPQASPFAQPASSGQSQPQLACLGAQKPDPETAEPLRAFNLYMQQARTVPLITEAEQPGVGWVCHISALGASVSGAGSSKKTARRESVRAFLRALRAS